MATPKIRMLSPHIAERIAAGEVIERPASVVKELVENSLDAGATEVAIHLEDGGKSLIEILDNGHGMGPADLELCVLRHATSKLSSLEDLEKIMTLGFRGEALPSVSAAADLSLLSRAKGSEDAYEFTPAPFSGKSVTPKAVTFGHFLNSPHGTRIRAQGLFSQIPARLKFLKSQAAEVSQVREWVERLAIAHPGVGFRLQSDGRTVLQLRGSTEAGRVQAVLSDGESYPLVSQESEGLANGIRVRAHWLQGMSTPQMRRLIQVVNGRPLRDRMLQQAILSAFRQTLMPGQFPALALFVEIEPSQLDVNVHPAKTEIRFLKSNDVFHEVSSLLSTMISRHGAPSFAPARTSVGFMSTSSGERDVPIFSAREAEPPVSWNQPAVFTPPQQEKFELPAAPRGDELAASHPFRDARLAGMLFNTYLVYELGEELILIDQHAADERIRYEAIRRRVERAGKPGAPAPAMQSLLLPEAVHFPPEARATLEGRLGWLQALGFDVELFGENAVLFRGLPPEWSNVSLKTRLKGLLDRVLSHAGGSATPQPADLLMDEALFESLASEACHSAVRAGDRLETVEAEAIMEKLFRCDHPWNCPHGRHTVVRVPRGRLEEWFQRRI